MTAIIRRPTYQVVTTVAEKLRHYLPLASTGIPRGGRRTDSLGRTLCGANAVWKADPRRDVDTLPWCPSCRQLARGGKPR